jgi:hypothetical protein
MELYEDAEFFDLLGGSYRGDRIAKSGRRFWIDRGVVWQLLDSDGVPWGQAATFPVEPQR